MERDGVLQTPELSAHVGVDHQVTSGIPPHAGRERERQLGAELVAAPRRVPRRIHVEYQAESGTHVGSKTAPRFSAGEPELHADLDQRQVGSERPGLASGGRRIGAGIDDESVAMQVGAGELEMQRLTGGDLVARAERQRVARTSARHAAVRAQVTDKDYGSRMQKDVAIGRVSGVVAHLRGKMERWNDGK